MGRDNRNKIDGHGGDRRELIWIHARKIDHGTFALTKQTEKYRVAQRDLYVAFIDL